MKARLVAAAPMKVRLAVAALLCLAPVWAAADVLENAEILLEVAPDSGAIVRILDKRSGAELVTDPRMARLFQLMLPPIGERTRRVQSQQQRATTSRSAPDELEIRFESLQPDEEQYIFGSGEVHFPEAPLDIRVVVRLKLEGDHVAGTIAVDNHSRETVTAVTFPFVGGLNSAGEARPARIVLPSLSQRVFHNTMAAFTGQRASRYPAMLATGWLNFESEAGSLGLEARSGLQAQDAYFSLNPGHFHGGSAYEGRYEYPVVGWISYPEIAAGNAWTSAEMRLHVHSGDWHRIAAEHREWRRESLPPRSPDAWRDQLGFATYRLKDEDNTVRWSYADLPKLANDAAQAGLRRIVIDNWRQVEGPANPAPFGEIADPRLGGADALSKAIGALADRGVELVFTFHPALLNVFADRYPAEHVEWAVRSSRDAAQIPVDFLAGTLDYPALLSTNRYRVEIDPSSPATDFLLGEAARLGTEYGMRNLLLAGVGQRAFLSHARWGGRAPADAYAAGYARLLGGLRERFSGGLLLSEGFNDLVNGYADAAFTWDQSHEPSVLPFSLPWSLLSNDVEALDYRMVNLSFAHGALINLVVDGGSGTVARYAGFAAHLRALRELKAATVKYYAAAEFRDRQGLAGDEESGDVIARVFRNEAAGTGAVVVANLAGSAGSAALRLAFKPAPKRALLYRAGAADAGAAVDLSGTLDFTLQPHEVILLALEF